MKKKELMLIGFVLMMLPMVLGVEISLSKQEYLGFETLQAEITGNFISLEAENVLIYDII